MSILSNFMGMLDPGLISKIGSELGESPEAVNRGFGSIGAATLAGLGQQATNPGALSQIFDLISNAAPVLGTSGLAGLLGPGAQSLAASATQETGIASRLMPLIFGSNSGGIASSIAKFAGLRSQSASTLMGLAIPAIAGIIGNRIRQENMNPAALARTLVQEAKAVTDQVPTNLHTLLTAAPAALPTPSSSRRWWPLLALAGVLLIFWIGRTIRSADSRPVTDAVSGNADRIRAAGSSLGDFVSRNLPGNISLKIPSNGSEAHLLTFIQGPSAIPGKDSWFDFDRLTFESGSATVRAESQEQLRNVAEIMKAYPRVRLKIGGYTDNVGDANANLLLSRQRADAVVAQLVNLGVPAERLSAEGYGEQNRVADNSTEEGRAMNRRISMRVLDK
jgi:OOP family OmpA-OmpF porin